MVKQIVQLLRGLADTIERDGMPKEPILVQVDPRENEQIFIAVWQNKTENRLQTVFEARPFTVSFKAGERGAVVESINWRRTTE